MTGLLRESLAPSRCGIHSLQNVFQITRYECRHAEGMSRRASRRRRRSGTHQLSGVDQRLRFSLSPFRARHSRNASGHWPHRGKGRRLKAAGLTTSPRAFRRRFVRRRRVRDMQTAHQHPVQSAPSSHSAAKVGALQITRYECRRAEGTSRRASRRRRRSGTHQLDAVRLAA
jgi:hypothetical protein